MTSTSPTAKEKAKDRYWPRIFVFLDITDP